jgi:Spy/CpxP family protein refolding chaperone
MRDIDAYAQECTMKGLTRLIGAALAATVLAGAVAAQDPPPQASTPQARQRLHAPGTGLQEGVIPQRQRIGARGWMGAGGGMYAPRALLAQKDLLGLSEDQVAQLQKLETQFAEQHQNSGEELRTLRQELRDTWSAEDPDLSVVRTKMKAVMDAEQALQLSRIDAEAKAKGLLNQEQLGEVRSFAQGYRVGARRGAGAMRGMGRGGTWPGGRGAMPGYGRPGGMRGQRPIR